MIEGIYIEKPKQSVKVAVTMTSGETFDVESDVYLNTFLSLDKVFLYPKLPTTVRGSQPKNMHPLCVRLSNLMRRDNAISLDVAPGYLAGVKLMSKFHKDDKLSPTTGPYAGCCIICLQLFRKPNLELSDHQNNRGLDHIWVNPSENWPAPYRRKTMESQTTVLYFYNFFSEPAYLGTCFH
ncbi:hypothetical protein BDR03DRAFT_1046208 [Suillus americanus]|nr:hypothetical protein BDR03DRAFT_1046208 [Suillus americanus]